MKSTPLIPATIALTMLLSCNSNRLSDEKYIDKHARWLHTRMVTLDTHNDTPLSMMRPGFDFSGANNTARGSRVDLRKMEQGGLDGAFFAVFLGQGECTPEKYEAANTKALQIFDAVHGVVAQHADKSAIALNPNDIYTLKETGKRAIYLGVENGYPIGTDLSLLHKYYDLGARYITLCHTRNNQICDSSTDPSGPQHNGLSEFGRRVVREMNRMGMLIDVSHISDKSFYDVLEASGAPVFASHSCARAICNNPRNLSDDMLKALAQKGGVVQMCILSDYVKAMAGNAQRDSARAALRAKYNNFQNLSPEQEKQLNIDWYALEEKFPAKLATVADVVDHIDHIVKVAGINHVGIGTDFDGGGGVEGCRNAGEMINITKELIRRGYSDKDIKKIWGENFLRVFKDAQNYSNSIH
jgi:membrane dipeptidase